MTRKSKARYGMNRTYKINPAVKALRNALFAGMAMAAVAPAAQAACSVVGNTITCTGAFGSTLVFGPGDVALPFDPTIINLDAGTDVDVLGNYGVFALSLMDLTLTNDGSVNVYNEAGNAVGIFAQSTYGNTDVINNGSISAESNSGDVAGIVSVSAYADAAATNNGIIETYTVSGDAYGMYVGSAYGDVSASTGPDGSITAESVSGDATGIRAESFAGDVSVDSAGAITATTGSGYAFGIYAQSVYGDVSVDNSGAITATVSNGLAFGIYAGTYFGSVAVNNDGDIHAESTNGSAFGISAYSYASDVSISGSGNISAETTNGNALGIAVFSVYGDISIDTGGEISAESYIGNAIGINARGYYDITISGSSAIEVDTYRGAATGINAVNSSYAGPVTVDVSGDISAYAYRGNATGINAYSFRGDIDVTSTGDIDVTSTIGNAIGIRTGRFGYSTVDNSGDISAYTYRGNAIGIQADSYDGITIANSGDLSAETTIGSARGIQALANGFLAEVAVVNSGDIDATSYTTGSAQGIRAKSDRGYTIVENSGDISATSTFTNAIAILATGQYGVEVSNTGDLSANSDANVYGIYAQSRFGDAYVYNAGDISANATFYAGSGIYAKAGYDAIIVNSGDLSASSDYAVAYGAYAYAQFGDAAIINSGDISATAYNDASGLFAKSLYGIAYISNSGDVSVDSDYGIAAYGLYASAMQSSAVVLNYGGDISATGYDADASAIVAVALDDVVVYNGGALSAYSVNGDAIGIVGAVTDGSVTIYNAGEISAESVYGNAYGIYADSDFGDVAVYSDAEMSVYSEYGLAVGIWARADEGSVYVSNGGDLHVSSGFYGAAAVGIYASGKYGVSVTNGGDLTVSSTNYGAVGIYASSPYAVEVGNSGDIDVSSYYGVAQGIFAYSLLEDVSVGNGGDIDASSVYAVAEGITAISFLGDVSVTNSGDLTVSSEYGDATGVHALVGGKYSEITVNNTGVINAWADDYATGILAIAEAGDISIANNSAITANGYYATGISASTGSFTNYYGEYAYTYSGNISVVAGAASNINANAVYDAYGMNLEADGYVNVSNAGSIKATASGDGAFSVGIRTESGFTTSITNSGSIDAAGDNAWAIVTYSEGTTISNTASGKIFGAIWTGSGDDSFTNAGKWYVGDINGSDFNGGDDSVVNSSTGKIFMDDSYISMGYSEGSANSFLNNGKLYANGDNYIDMGGSTSVFTNNGSSIHMDDADVNDTLTIYGDFAGTGHIVVNASGSSLLADRLYIEGDVVTNTANIIDVKLLSGPSIADMLAGETIDIVHVSGTSTAANFNIGIVTPPFDELYTVETSLIKAINYSGTNDLFSLGFDISGLSTAGVVASSVAPGVQNLWNQGTGTLFQREGTHREFNQNPDGSGRAEYKAAAGVWVRGFTSSGSVSPDAHRDNFGAGGSNNFDMDGSGIEFGVGYAFNSQWTAGLLGGTSESTVDPDAGGRADIDADTLGAYVTYTPGNGFYADFSYRAMDFDGYGMGGQSEFGFEGSADGYSLEMGYGYKMASGLIIEPQFQYSSVDVDLNTIGYNMSDFELTNGDSSLLRIGAALRKSYKTAGGNYWTPYGALSWLNETDGTNSYEIGGLLTGDVDTGGGSALLEAGVTGFIGKFGVSAGMNWRDGSAYDSVIGGQLSLRYDW